MTGRPSSFTKDLADELCARLAQGKSLRSVCAADDMPALATVFRWLRTDEAFRDQYARAKEESADALADEMLFISDTPVEGVIDKLEMVTIANPDDPDLPPVQELQVVERRVEDMLAHRKLQVDTRKWLASKLKPKKYGDKLEVDNKGQLTLNVGIKRFAAEDPAKDPAE